jgi:AraC-like DNA-binding protein
LGGIFLEQSGAENHTRRGGDAVYHPAGERHANDFGEFSALCLNVHVEVEDAGFFTRRMPARARSLAAELAREISRGDGADSLTLQCLEGELLAFLSTKRARASGAYPVEVVLDALTDEPQKHWSLAELAALVGWHPNHLARQFRTQTGVSAGKWRRRHRALRAYADIRTTRGSLADIAQAHGYADQAHMTRELKVYAALPPGALRRMR